MGVTNNTVNIVNGKTENVQHWVASIYTANATGTEIAVPDPGDGYALCLESIDIMTQTNSDVTILHGASILFGPMEIDATSGGQIHLEFLRPVECTASAALNVDTSDSAPISVITQGFTRKTS